ncbi:MAG: hypothetical protein EAZ95_10595 [Bacteroidetes bacterium]|nr:MAG: hypothetical protein EAZ95_10595 [Bacteroidota bacterium]
MTHLLVTNLRYSFLTEADFKVHYLGEHFILPVHSVDAPLSFFILTYMSDKQETSKTKYTAPKYLKMRGYRHVTGKIKTSPDDKKKETPQERDRRFGQKLSNTAYIQKYNFFPLLKYIKIENKYKKQNNKEEEKAGNMVFIYKSSKEPLRKNEPKERPIEYPTHNDALIYAFYAQELLAPMYEHLLSLNPKLSESVIGYRKLPIDATGKKEGYKSTIHFSKDVFQHIQELGECYVLTFDIKNFFPSLNHIKLREALLELIKKYAEQPKNIDKNTETAQKITYTRLHKKLKEWESYFQNDKLPPDLYNVYKAVTRYAYMLLRDLKRTDGKRGFDEARLAQIRQQGIDAFFANPKEMREYIAENNITIHKNGKTGIPHGLPISAYLANIYMRAFDEQVMEKLKDISSECLYRRYSDDMIVVFPAKQTYKETITDFFSDAIKGINLKIAPHKTEFFWTEKNELGFWRTHREVAFQVGNEKAEIQTKQCPYPITYLGLEYHGECEAQNEVGKRLDVRLKNASIQKFYRRMDMAVRRQVRRAFQKQDKDLAPNPIVFRRRLYRLFSTRGANKKYRNTPKEEPKDKITPRRIKRLTYSEALGYFTFTHEYPKKKLNKKTKKEEYPESMKHKGNAITFAKRCDYIFWGAPAKGLPAPSIMLRQYRKANKLLEKRIAYWIEYYKLQA